MRSLFGQSFRFFTFHIALLAGALSISTTFAQTPQLPSPPLAIRLIFLDEGARYYTPRVNENPPVPLNASFSALSAPFTIPPKAKPRISLAFGRRPLASARWLTYTDTR